MTRNVLFSIKRNAMPRISKDRKNNFPVRRGAQHSCNIIEIVKSRPIDPVPTFTASACQYTHQ